MLFSSAQIESLSKERFSSYLRLNKVEQKDYAVDYFCNSCESWNTWNAWEAEKCQSICYRDEQQDEDCAKPTPACSHPKPKREKERRQSENSSINAVQEINRGGGEKPQPKEDVDDSD